MKHIIFGLLLCLGSQACGMNNNVNLVDKSHYDPIKKLVAKRMILQGQYDLQKGMCEVFPTLRIDESQVKLRVTEARVQMAQSKKEFDEKGVELSKLMESATEKRTEEEMGAEIRGEACRAQRLYHYRLMLPEDAEDAEDFAVNKGCL